ncbi:hypothetical protein CEXT_784221 [Caerostris extrusa]|uniref:Uncharacterized protein n=1 Tax=Caerostris extrusa TaxID=172846 RepID=A0AAV4MJD2_CAEEX|nr:hypothetical protein CEXT_784221 [Caerostris extrusa]
MIFLSDNLLFGLPSSKTRNTLRNDRSVRNENGEEIRLDVQRDLLMGVVRVIREKGGGYIDQKDHFACVTVVVTKEIL